MLTTVVFIGVFSALILIHEWGHFVVARRAGVRVERFSLGFGPRLWRWQRGETEYCVSLVPMGGYVKMAGESTEDERTGAAWEYLSKSIGTRAAIVFAGPFLNYVLAWVAFVSVFMLGYPSMAPTIGEVLADKPAAQSDVLVGDRITAINGQPVTTWDDVTKRIHEHPGAPITLALVRGDEALERQVVPQPQEMRDALGRLRTVGLIGIVPSGEVIQLRYGPVRAVAEGTKHLWTGTVMTIQALVNVATGQLSFRESVAGPVGIFVMTGEAARLGLVYVIHMMAVLSMSLAVFNVLPIPVLDGGHLLFLALEALRGGKAVSIRIRTAATNVGMALLLMLMVVVFYGDLARFGVTDKVVRWWRGQETAPASTPVEAPTP